MIGVVDYGGGNLASVQYALDHLEIPWVGVRRPLDLGSVEGIIFPGVGAAGPTMAALRRSGLDQALQLYLAGNRPYLGICLGLQILFESSEEDDSRCLGTLPGRVIRIPTREKLPHVGWNTLEADGSGSLVQHFDQTAFYFTHSFVVAPGLRSLTTSWTTYGSRWPSAVQRGAVIGVQFHPERSGAAGLALLKDFGELSRHHRCHDAL